MSKNILFIAPYRQGDGWGKASQDFALAMETTKHNIAIRPIYMDRGFFKQEAIDPKLIEMEGRSFDKYDMVIENVLPNYYEKTEVPTLAFLFLETNNLDKTFWYRPMSIMDGIIVASDAEKTTVDREINTPCWNVGGPLDSTVEDEGDLEGIPKDTFNFYFIGESIDRKNLEALITAFHLEFYRSEPVNLILKLNKSGMDSRTLSQHMQKEIQGIKNKLRIYEDKNLYKSEYLITDRLTEKEMVQLHTSCNCFVMPSRGEAFCRPAARAMVYGNTPIVTDNTGMTAFINDETGWVVPSKEVPLVSRDYPLKGIYTSRETWYDIDILALGKAMREAYTSDRTDKIKAGMEMAKALTYESVGKNIERVIDEYDSSQ